MWDKRLLGEGMDLEVIFKYVFLIIGLGERVVSVWKDLWMKEKVWCER